eukprot:CAMPEP_0119424288 /NCGR_PEP_ID=MMETSP1335-20130426/32234_1 /TAXON_ID=259385 /ORGANISM="Chrysoculter rhomboideus, Strain RCC1486" /LENGTH=140 /DNA_ID=CAMNT_0007449809 /DNA_START=20 /DNA_END=438 /DNA_ORIENTATION=-
MRRRWLALVVCVACTLAFLTTLGVLAHAAMRACTARAGAHGGAGYSTNGAGGEAPLPPSIVRSSAHSIEVDTSSAWASPNARVVLLRLTPIDARGLEHVEVGRMAEVALQAPSGAHEAHERTHVFNGLSADSQYCARMRV